MNTNKKIKKKNKRFVALGVFVALLLVAVLIFFMSSEYELAKEQSYSVEIYHSGPIAQSMEELNKEMATLLMSTKLPASSGFISPVVELHEKLNAGETSKVEVPIGGLTWLVGKCFSGFYDFESRKGDEEDMLGENGSLFSRDDYKYFSVSALANGDPAVNQVIHDVNNSTEFFINGNLPGISSADKVVWKSLAELKKHLDSLISSGKISSETVVKIYYQGGNTESDTDRDGVLDNVDGCPGVAGDVSCGGCLCETAIIEEPRVEDVITDISFEESEPAAIDAGLKYESFSNNPSWKKIPGASSINLKIKIEGNPLHTDGSEPFGASYDAGGSATQYSFGVKGGLNKTRTFSIVLTAKDSNGNEMNLINNVLNKVSLSCTN